MSATLTAAHKARIPEWTERWTEIALNTQPAEYDEAEKSIRTLYKIGELDDPYVVHVDSPLAASIVGTCLEAAMKMVKGETTGMEPKGEIVLGNGFEYEPSTKRLDTLDDLWGVQDHVTEVMLKTLPNLAPAGRRICMRNVHSVINQFKQTVWQSWQQYRGGGLWPGWYSFVSFYRDVVKIPIENVESFNADAQFAMHSSWAWFGDHVVAISGRPTCLTSTKGELHDENKPVLGYGDGFELWYLNGIRVNRQIVLMPEYQTIDSIDAITNTEMRRVAIERYAGRGTAPDDGILRYFEDAGAEPIDDRMNHNMLEILLKLKATPSRPERIALVLKDASTKRRYVKPMPPEVTTCEQAQDMLSGGLARFVTDLS